MVLAGAVILPHGALIFDGDPQSPSNECQERYRKMNSKMKEATMRLYKGCVEAGERVVAMNPELIIVHSPHGTLLSRSVALYGNSLAAGSAEWEGHWKEFDVKVPLCTETTEAIRKAFQLSNVPVEIVRQFSDLKPFPLCWGEAVPIWYIQKALKGKEVKFIILTSPRPKRVDRIEEDLLKQGSVLADFISTDPRRIVMVISGDLSHMYQYDCTEDWYTPSTSSNFPGPRDDEARAMEAAFTKWVLSSKAQDTDNESSDAKKRKITSQSVSTWDPETAMPFLQEAVGYNPSTLSCGMQGFIILHSLMSLSKKTKSLSSCIHTCEAPTYYGMMAASFSPTD